MAERLPAPLPEISAAGMKSTFPTLIFVYNGDSGRLNWLFDVAHKLFSPSTYPCKLCAVTHSAFSMQQEWRTFLAQLPTDFIHLHRDEFEQRFGLSNLQYPAILAVDSNAGFSELVSSQEINVITSLAELTTLVIDRLKQSQNVSEI